ncbi:NADH dehydrogenase [ubiquinone] flavoprotein 3, mitochondrial [Indicator indicator]|uniref:NADH dehydrogenase [ubiquinone] flavoprotein 3, mitochondrial n=1 Tax=Indicator indicator TaxID=1002788 RepID=UPI0023DF6F02|nr:NADH dehydrogenase [ubiquinone] flavoprotein 3, mitochondrial [Indicator indicator]
MRQHPHVRARRRRVLTSRQEAMTPGCVPPGRPEAPGEPLLRCASRRVVFHGIVDSSSPRHNNSRAPMRHHRNPAQPQRQRDGGRASSGRLRPVGGTRRSRSTVWARVKMAAPSLLGCGRAATRRVLRLEARGLGGAAPSAALCTRPAGSGTPPGNVVAPQGSTKLLATKAPVEFPKMLSSSSLLASSNKSESLSSTNLEETSKASAEDLRMFMSRKTIVAFPQRVGVSSLKEENITSPATEGGLRKELVEEETSSSSDSDSSSDSEEENDDSEVGIKTKPRFPRQDSVFSENIAVKASKLAKENLSQKSQKEYVAKKKSRKTETGVSPVKQVTFSKTTVGHEMSKSKARDPKVKSAPKEAGRQKLVLEPHVVESQDLGNVTYKSDYLEEKSIGTQVSAIQMKASSVTQEDKKQKQIHREEEKVKKAQKSEAEAAAAPKLQETSESTVLVVGTTAKEDTIQEAGLQDGERSTIEETTAADKPAPEEFDNSTYKNLQHHEYNIYTFADYITVLSKYRQPQPSSGRPSPRH